MDTYHKIQGLYKRDMNKESSNYGKFIIGQYSLPEFELLKNILWEWTEKIDGTNIRCIFYTNPLIPNKIEFKGKTDKAEIPKHLLIKLQELFTEKKLQKIFEMGEDKFDVCLYGEGYGYKIQKGEKYFDNKEEVDFILFDIKLGNKWLSRKKIIEIAQKLNIKTVPIIGEGTIDEAEKFVKKGFKSTFGNFIAEGLVIKPKYELKDIYGHRIITKIKYRDFKEELNENS